MLQWISIVVSLIAFTAASKFTPSNSNSFNELVGARDLVLVEFCVPWYEPCKNLSPELDRAAETLSKRDISIVSIDCTTKKLQGLCKNHGIESYPTIRIFRGLDENTRYRGRQDEKSITSFMIKQTLPVVSLVNENDFQELKSLGLPVLIIFIRANDEKSQQVFDAFTSVAESLQNEFIFGRTSDFALYEETSIDSPFIVLYNPLDEADLVLKGNLNEAKIARFAKSSSAPLIGMFGPDTFAKYTDSETPLALIFAETAEERKSFGRMLKNIAAKYATKINFATVDAKKYGFFSESLGLDATRFPGFVIHDTRTDEVFQFDQSKKITAEAIRKFVEDFVRSVNRDVERTVEAVMTARSEIHTHDEI